MLPGQAQLASDDFYCVHTKSKAGINKGSLLTVRTDFCRPFCATPTPNWVLGHFQVERAWIGCSVVGVNVNQHLVQKTSAIIVWVPFGQGNSTGRRLELKSVVKVVIAHHYYWHCEYHTCTFTNLTTWTAKAMKYSKCINCGTLWIAMDNCL